MQAYTRIRNWISCRSDVESYVTSAIHVSQDTLSIQTDCFVILSCCTAGNFTTRFCDCYRPHPRSQAMQVHLQVEAAVLHDSWWHFSNWFLSPLDSTLPQSTSTSDQDCCARWSCQVSAEQSNWGLDHFWVYKVPWCHCGSRSVNPNVLVK